MRNNKYNKITLETVTQGEVCGNPVRSYDPFRLTKTILFFILVIINNSFCDDFINEIHLALDKFNENSIIKINYIKKAPETAEEAEAKYAQEQEDAKAVALNKYEVRNGIYWVNKSQIIK